MSASEYLRRKAAKTMYIINTVKSTDSSMQTLKIKHGAAQVFALGGNFKGTTLESGDLQTSGGKTVKSYVKNTGRPADSSSFTSYRGSQAIGDNKAAARGKLRSEGCLDSTEFPEPQTYAGFGKRIANTVSTNSSTRTHAVATCNETLPDAHNNGDKVVDKPQFVDNTISLNGYNQLVCLTSSQNVPAANHSLKAVTPLNIHPSIVGAKRSVPIPLGPNNVPSYKAGAAIANIRYVERHHGNDSNVNPKQIPKRFQGSHLAVKGINVPRFGNIKP
jgi:hypothetical protein